MILIIVLMIIIYDINQLRLINDVLANEIADV